MGYMRKGVFSVSRMAEGGKIVPISLAGVLLGNRVRSASDGGLYTVIGQEISGWIIANGKGEVHSGQLTESLSPYTRIAVEESLPLATTEEIEALKEAIEEKRQSDEIERKAQETRKQSDYEKILAGLKVKYPSAEQTGSSYARAAKNLKAELKTAFPTVKFSVKSEAYAGGSSVRIEWTDGCPNEQVEKFSNKYEYGKFDSTDDIYNYDSSAYAKAVGEWLGSAKYVSTTRNFSGEVKAQVSAAIKRGAAREINSYDLDTKVYQALAGAEIYGAFLKLELEDGREVARFAAAMSTRANVKNVSTGFITGEFTHTTKGTTCFAATLVERMTKTEFSEIFQIAKSSGGYYSTYNKNDAIAGFIFSSEEKRREFLSRFD